MAQDIYEYTLLEGMDTKEVAEATTKAWAPVAATEQGASMLLERAINKRVDVSAAASFSVPKSAASLRRLDTFRTSTMQKELNDAGAQGYRVVRIPLVEPGFGLTITMEKVGEPPAAFEYLLVGEKDEKKMQAALNDGAAKGFRVVPGGAGRANAAVGTETLVLMERPVATSSAPFKYRVVGATRLSTFDMELAQAKQEGGELVGIVGSGAKSVLGGRIAILERFGNK